MSLQLFNFLLLSDPPTRQARLCLRLSASASIILCDLNAVCLPVWPGASTVTSCEACIVPSRLVLCPALSWKQLVPQVKQNLSYFAGFGAHENFKISAFVQVPLLLSRVNTSFAVFETAVAELPKSVTGGFASCLAAAASKRAFSGA